MKKPDALDHPRCDQSGGQAIEARPLDIRNEAIDKDSMTWTWCDWVWQSIPSAEAGLS
jgi:hypothetical protein